MEDTKPGKMREYPESPISYQAKEIGIGQSAGEGVLTQAELGWLAGLWDGEGSITMFRHYEQGRERHYVPVVCLTNTDPTIINHAVALLDRLGVRMRVGILRKSDGKNAECYQIITNKHSVIGRFLKSLSPYLIGKRPQAGLLLRFVNSRIEAASNASANRFAKYDVDLADKIEEDIRSMNKKGPKPQRLNVGVVVSRGATS